MGRHDRYHSRSRSSSRSRSYSRDRHRHSRRSRSRDRSRSNHLSKAEWNELKTKSKFGHSTKGNRFGDDDLDTPFVWKKKEDKSSTLLSEKQLVLKRLENSEVILKAQAKREEENERKMERRRRREEKEEKRELQESKKAMQKAEEMQLTQKLIGMRIRIIDGREKPVDRILKNILLLDELNKPTNPFDNTVLGADIRAEEEPVEDIIASLDLQESNELLQNIDEIMPLPEMEPFLNYLAAVRAVVVEHMGDSGDDANAIHASVVEDVKALVEDKSFEEIEALRKEISEQVESGEAMDVDYWSAVLSLLRLASFKATLKTEQARLMQNSNLDKQRRLKEEQQRIAAIPSRKRYTEADALEGIFSPEPIIRSQIPDRNILIVDPEIDMKQLAVEREMVRHRELEALSLRLTKERHEMIGSEHVQNILFDNGTLAVPTKGTLQKDEEEMKDEVQLPHQTFNWQQKYTPQKPIYFNKVKSGYDWNQYNQTHYDPKNPPPKVIQGYSFNIFYPDLVDKNQRPSFTLEPDPNDNNWCVIRFHAGAPYEDIAFRIVNRAWDRSRKSRFRNEFERGVLHLYFDFKKYRYKFTLYVCMKHFYRYITYCVNELN